MVRCVAHDTTHEKEEPCPSLGVKNDAVPDGDCEKHRVPVLHNRKRVLNDGGKWDEVRQKAVE